jgi:enoyl-CoA hydratase
LSALIHRQDLGEGVVALTIKNEAKRNALSEATIQAFALALDDVAGVRCFLIRGEGKHFCAGSDLSQLTLSQSTQRAPDAQLLAAMRKIESAVVPVVACVTGAAIGAGCDLAAACDVIVADETAFFQMPPARIGVVYGLEGMTRLAARIGIARAKRLFLTAEIVSSRAALAMGLVDDIASEKSTAEATAQKMAQTLAALAPQSLAGTKIGFGLLKVAASELAAFEAIRMKAYASQDIEEGRAALIEKRVARFTGA